MTPTPPADAPAEAATPLPPSGTTQELLAAAAAAVAENGPRAAAGPWRQAFHIQPPTGLLNDPNGLCQHEGTYHVFYQWHPFAPAHKLKFWAHLTSPDLVTWTEQPIALVPDASYDAQGCYSGSAIVHDGQVHLLYTGNVRSADGGRFPTQCLARITAEGTVTKDPANPVVAPLPGFSPHVRDPKVFARDGSYWMVLGAQSLDLFGTLALLRSTDLRSWELVGPIAGGAQAAEGYMWECPDLISLDGRDVLLVSPQYDLGPDAGSGRFRDVARYALGELDLQAGVLGLGQFVDLDFGPDFYAPQTFVDESGRTLLIGWMGKPDQPGQPTLAEKHPSAAQGWVHCLTVPRTLALREGDTLVQWPVPELEALRTSSVEHHDVRIAAGETVALPGVRGERLDLTLSAQCAPGTTLTVALRAGSGQATVLRLSPDASVAVLDTTASGAGVGGVYPAPLPTSGTLSVRILLDTSSVEVFCDGGAVVFSARIYPEGEASGIRVSATGADVVLTEVTCHQLGAAAAGEGAVPGMR